MAEIVRMPLMSDTMTEGTIAEWHKKVGDAVESGELLAEIETDKATMEFEAPEDGVLLWKADAAKPIPVNSLLAIIADEDEEVDVESILAEEKSNSPQEEPAAEEEDNKGDNSNTQEEETKENQTNEGTQEQSKPKQTATQPNTATKSNTGQDGRLKASPLARNMASNHGIDITKIQGSGDEGRIVKRDIQQIISNQQSANKQPAAKPVEKSNKARPTSTNYKDVPVSNMRKTIARRLGESKFEAPHFYLTMQINMDEAIKIRKRLNSKSETRISFNDLVVKATAMALRKHPAINSSWLGDTIRFNKDINIGVAVAVDEGLLVPVLMHADNMSLSQIAQQTGELAEKARNKKLSIDEMQGNTFTISNLGMFGINEFTAIINPPDACILAVGGINKVVSVTDTNDFVATNVMKITLSCDHRVVDGATGAKFLQTLKTLLEDPMMIMV